MCSFLVTNWLLANLTYVNFFLRPRGPDHTSQVDVHGFSFVHNLLHMTGERVLQPFANEAGDVVALYNGEIYNFAELAGPGDVFRSDGEAILPLYARHGEGFSRTLDGEFALAVFDFSRRRAVFSTDAFSTKPLWYSTHDGLHVASYQSGLLRLGIPEGAIHMIDPNTILTLDLTPGQYRVLERRSVVEFDLRQFKNDTSDFHAAFERAVRKRVKHAIHPLFIGLSSGYDSGAIQVALSKDQIGHFAYTIYSTEDIEILRRRIEWAADTAETNVIVLSGRDIEREAGHLAELCEPFHYRAKEGQEFKVSEDPASSGLSFIFREVRRRGILVYLSGTGADEIISDYGHGGKKIFPHSNFGGLFPEDLGTLFPWNGFFLGTQRDYLMKEELVAGVHGVEGRYPFLDRNVVQEFLWLTAEAKNLRYKAPIHDWLERFDYPFRSGEKLGFNAAHNVRWDVAASEVFTYNSRPHPKKQVSHQQVDGGISASGPAGVASSTCEFKVSELESNLRSMEEELIARRQQLEAQAAHLAAEATELEKAQLQLQQQAHVVDASWRQLREQAAVLQEHQRSQVDSALRFMALRYVPLQGAAASLSADASFYKEPLTAPASGSDSANADAGDAGHPLWSGVEVLTCVSGGRFVNVMDFPVYHIFRASTPLPVHNLCENVEWEGMHMRLRLYRRFLNEHLERARGAGDGREKLFIVSDGMDVIFNDLAEVISADPDLRGLTPAQAAALLVIRRYESVVGSAVEKPRAVFSSERLCGWGGAHLCSEEDLARYPEATTDSRYLNAGGYIGPPGLLAEILGAVLGLAASARHHAGMGDLRAKTTAEDAVGGETDQYFFKLYFWEHPDVVVLDYHQIIFGNFLEVEPHPCYDGWKPRCAMEPCCTVSDNFTRFHEVFYGNYEVRGCSIWRSLASHLARQRRWEVALADLA